MTNALYFTLQGSEKAILISILYTFRLSMIVELKETDDKK